MQRGYKEIMKLVADNKNYEVERLMDEGSYVVKARKKTFSAIHDLNEFNRKSAAEANKANNVAAFYSFHLFAYLHNICGGGGFASRAVTD